MPEWQQIGSVEVCVGTDGVTGVWNEAYVDVVFGSGKFATAYSKEEFEAAYCQPPEPKHRLIESCGGSVCVVSTEEQGGNPVRMAYVRDDVSTGRYGTCCDHFYCTYVLKQEAIDRAIRYVEKRE